MKCDLILNKDCIQGMKEMHNESVMFTLTDIPYGVVNRKDNGLRNLNKENADIETFDLIEFLEEVYRVTKNSICIFCAKEQFSAIYKFFASKKGTVRPVVWKKTNPSPMNGQYIYLSGVEFAVWFKKSGAKVFNAHCKNTVFEFPNGKRAWHPTQKNLDLFIELIKDNTNEKDLVFDPCMGGGTTALACINTNRHFFGFEINEQYYKNSLERICRNEQTTTDYFGKERKLV
jgi:DNA modification methylase